MAKTKTLVNLIKEMVRQEVKKEVREIFIREGVKAVTQNKNIVPEVLAKPSPKKTKPKEIIKYLMKQQILVNLMSIQQWVVEHLILQK